MRNIEPLAIGALVHAVTLDDPTVLHFGLATELEIDSGRPIYFRRLDALPILAEFNFFPKSALEPVTIRVFLPCLTEVELRIHLTE
ncbi:hypothetical protein BHK69_30785 (plasmid) [Bosea vaviloviae]|uniref:Uncharacterized protein n=1 Tax=Bosea vaviloviae TaxID=1526658 RepID=A0A1D7UCJ2_9HYPH|nr:hypothetical protein BHK69_30785 [Bosea vaviloviae]